MARYVAALDPGKTTGYAVWCQENPIMNVGQEADFTTMAQRLDRFLHSREVQGDEVTVVCERFIINVNTVGNSQAPWSLEMIGVARYLAARYGADFVMQAPSDAKRFMSDERLKKLGWWQKGKVHANDALRHLGLYLVTRKLMCVDVL